jgi:diacylglycerol kinase family enzyme
MQVQPLRASQLRMVPPLLERPEPASVAVVLNANARQVTEKVIRSLSHVIPEEDLFVSRCLPDCRRIAQTILERGYDVVFTGGGDGTFVGFVNEILRQVEHRSRYHPQRAPRFGILKLGTGNGIASFVSASPKRGGGILDDVLRARAGEIPGYRSLELLSVEGKRAPFAGLGADAKVLNDYYWVKERLGGGLLKPMLTGAGGYISSVTLRTLPHFLVNPSQVECEVVNGRRGPAYRLNPDGSVLGEVGPGELLFRGRLIMAAAATMPFYGFSFRMFPFAGRRPGHLHLRLGAVTATQVVSNLTRLWRGRWFPTNGIYDFHARDFTVRFATPMAFQIGGDAEGYRDTVSMGVSPEQIELVDFTGAVN